MEKDICNETKPDQSSPAKGTSFPFFSGRVHNSDRFTSSEAPTPDVVQSDLDRLYESIETTGVLPVFQLATWKKLIQCSPSVEGRVIFLHNLGGQLRSLYDTRGRKEILDDAILAYNLAAELVPADHPKRGELLVDAREARNHRLNLDRNFLGPVHNSEMFSSEPGAPHVAPLDLDRLYGSIEGAGALSAYQLATWKELIRRCPSVVGRVILLQNLGRQLKSLYNARGQKEILDSANIAYDLAVEMAPVDHSNVGESLVQPGEAPEERFSLYPKLPLVSGVHNWDKSSSSESNTSNTAQSDLDRLCGGIEAAGALPVFQLAMWKASIRCCASVADRVMLLHSLACQLMLLYSINERKEILDSSILAYDLAVEIVPVDYPQRVELLVGAGGVHEQRFISNQRRHDIDEAISNFQAALNQIQQNHQNFPIYLGSLGTMFYRRFKRTGDPTDLSQAISNVRMAVQYTSDSDANRPGLLNSLALALQCCYEQNGVINDLTESISMSQAAIRLTPSNHVHLPGYLCNLGNSLTCHFLCTNSVKSLSDSITRLRTANRLSPSHCGVLNGLGTSLRYRYERTRNIADLSESISHFQKAIHLTPNDHPSTPYFLNSLGASLERRFQSTGDILDLQAAISALQTSISLTPDGDVELPSRLTTLGTFLQTSYMHSRHSDPSELSESITILQTAIRHFTLDHAHRPTALHQLSMALLRRFEHIGDIGDLTESISTSRTAISLTPKDHAELPYQLHTLGQLLSLRFEHVGEITDLTESIAIQQTAVASFPKGHIGLPFALHDLAIAIGNHFQHTGQFTADVESLSLAISSIEWAIQFTPETHIRRTAFLSDLAKFLALRSQYPLYREDLSKAISTLRTATDLSQKGDPDPTHALSLLGGALRDRFERDGKTSDLAESISILRAVIDFDCPVRHRHLQSLGKSLHLRFQLFHDIDDAMSAIDAYREAATSKSSPTMRLLASHKWAELSQRFKTSETLEAYTLVVNLLSQIASMENTIRSRHEKLLRVSHSMISAAVSAALSFGSPMLALEWLEQGRCLVWTQLNQLRTPLNDLRSVDPALADRLSTVSWMLERGASRDTFSSEHENMHSSKPSLEDRITDQMKLANEWDELLDKVRRIPKFQDFLSPPRGLHIIESLPSCGPVIVINVHKDRCDALALFAQQNEPLHIPLHKFTYKQAEALRISLLEYLSSEGLRMPDTIRAGRPGERPAKDSAIIKVLEDLWRGVAQPILDAIGFEQCLPVIQRRIWWCPTGPLAFLPLHAAGLYNDPSGTSICVSDFAVSSYIPNVTTLINMVKEPRSQSPSSNSCLLVSQSEAPNLPRIPYADKEVEKLFDLMYKAKIKTVRVSGTDATVIKVKEEMGTHRNVHLACHAAQNVLRPLNSGFYLLDGQLELSEILKQKIPNADMAFLSACQTSAGALLLSEEVVHLAASMLAAGYRSVIATMWSISDNHGPDIANAFYSEMLSTENITGGPTLDGTRAAYALHHAIRKIRQNPGIGDTERGLLTWVPYVHFGI